MGAVIGETVMTSAEVLHTRVDPDVAQVAYERCEQADDSEKEKASQHYGIIAPDHGFVGEQTESVE
jgi:hypothetical protein